MEIVTRKHLYLVSGRLSRPLAEEIAHELDVRLGEPNLGEFANGEINCRFSESVRGTDVFSSRPRAAEVDRQRRDMEHYHVDAAKRRSAKRITVICPSTLRPTRPQGSGRDRSRGASADISGGRAKRMIWSISLGSDPSFFTGRSTPHRMP